MSYVMSNAASWSIKALLDEHVAQDLGFHVESLALRGATFAELCAQAVKGHVVVVDDAPASSVAPTMLARKAA